MDLINMFNSPTVISPFIMFMALIFLERVYMTKDRGFTPLGKRIFFISCFVILAVLGYYLKGRLGIFLFSMSWSFLFTELFVCQEMIKKLFKQILEAYAYLPEAINILMRKYFR